MTALEITNHLSSYSIFYLTFSLTIAIIVLQIKKTTQHKGLNIMTKAKEVNYTPENVERMVAVYAEATSDEQRKNAVALLAEELGKNVRSVIAKLSREGVYVKPTPATKAGAKIETKAEIVADIATNLKVEVSALASLSKATKAALVALRDAS